MRLKWHPMNIVISRVSRSKTQHRRFDESESTTLEKIRDSLTNRANNWINSEKLNRFYLRGEKYRGGKSFIRVFE